MRRPIHVYLLSPCELALASVRGALEEAEGLAYAGSAKSLDAALGALERLEVDVVVIEAGDDPATAREQLVELAGIHPRCKLLPLGLAGPREVLAFLEAGASGYVLRTDPWSRVVETIEGVVRGEPRCEPRVAALVCARIAELAWRDRQRLAGLGARWPTALSGREVQVLRLLAGGLQNKEIARRMGIALSTAANHVHKVFAKLGVHRRRDAVRRACEQGLLDSRALYRRAVSRHDLSVA